MSCCSSIIDVVTSKLPDPILACAKYSYGSDGQPALETAASRHEDNIFQEGNLVPQPKSILGHLPSRPWPVSFTDTDVA